MRNDPHRQPHDEQTLHQAGNVDIPVHAATGVEAGVDAREERAAGERREHEEDEGVEQGCEEQLVDVQGEGGEGEGC